MMIFSGEKKLPRGKLRAAITAAYRMDETECVNNLLKVAVLSENQCKHIETKARELVVEVRKQRHGKAGLDNFLVQYNLSTEEGVALLCLAEALLRVPDTKTIDRLIHDKLSNINWQESVGRSESFFVNATSWSLVLTGKMLSLEERGAKLTLKSVLQNLFERTSEPLIRAAVEQAMQIFSRQFIAGRTIEDAMKRAKEAEARGYRYSYDMLGEVARTAKDAESYFSAYQHAITVIGKTSKSENILDRPGISVKLSALHPRFEFAQRERILPDLIERVLILAIQAKKANIGITIDAEEAERLDLSLDVIESVFRSHDLKGWEGFGVVVQAYQKRALPLLDWLIDLSKQQQRCLMVRLVKGAYWDSEIKLSQVQGLSGYPVFTRKAATDVCYLACVKKMLAAPAALYCQFATHNAHTIATILELAGKRRDFEFQRLHSMGQALYDQIISAQALTASCRIYAPVGAYEHLLPYLVRRLLENGANTSFIYRIIDQQTPIKAVIADPIAKVAALKQMPHPEIPLPRAIYGAQRVNSKGLDLTNLATLQKLAREMQQAKTNNWQAKPMIVNYSVNGEVKEVVDPSDHQRVIGEVTVATEEEVNIALTHAVEASYDWDHTSIEKRVNYLENAANVFEQHYPELMAIAIREGGKTVADALAEVREATDYCRYYAQQARENLSRKNLSGPTGESNQLQMHGRGVAVCISPWNFPLAIFTGQVVASLVAGNVVIAKPAGQTPLMAAKVIALLHQAGIPENVLQLLPGSGATIGTALVKDPRVDVVLLTGSTATARAINQILANRPGPIATFIAETGGQNAMIVDSTALPEQLIPDILNSAFGSAGQRCSALRVLFLQQDIADRVIEMLAGAMAELQVGDPSLLQTDVGPVIDNQALQMLQSHARQLQTQSRLIQEVELPGSTMNGSFFAPCAFEIERLSLLKREVFGPILHVIRYRRQDLDEVISAINNTGYGLTLGIHSRIDETVEYIQKRVKVGNTYVNRNMIGAVVGVQPFGGEGLSGTGPKAGGPHYLQRLCVERTLTINTAATGGDTTLLTLQE